MHRVLVCGGRDFNDARLAYRTLDRLHEERPITLLIHGAARGADSFGAAWAMDQDIPTEAYPADWNRYGRSAGPRRNQQMLDEGRPDLVVAFPGGRGTADMTTRAERAGVLVQKVLGASL